MNQIKPHTNQSRSAHTSHYPGQRIRSSDPGAATDHIKGRHESDQHEARSRSSKKPYESIVHGDTVDWGLGLGLKVQNSSLRFLAGFRVFGSRFQGLGC